MKLLHKYLNGNVLVSLYEDGTKTQEWPDDENPMPIYPNSFDLKITNYCDLNCSFCHEMSTTRGAHGDMRIMLDLVEQLPAGTEIAIGGGNPLAHPDLFIFLGRCKELGLVPNITINFKHILPYSDVINDLILLKLVYGIGISIDETSDLKIMNMISDLSNVVYHVIIGVHSINILEKIKESPVKKVLLLGYKDVGRGIHFHDEKVDFLVNDWYINIEKYIKKIHLSFDNLAIKQLDVQRFLTKKEWDTFYCGNDGEFTFYIDLVKQQYALSSTSSNRYSLITDMSKMFNYIRTHRLD